MIFLSAVWPLILIAPIHIGEQMIALLQICSDEETNSSSLKTNLAYILDGLSEYIFSKFIFLGLTAPSSLLTLHSKKKNTVASI